MPPLEPAAMAMPLQTSLALSVVSTPLRVNTATLLTRTSTLADEEKPDLISIYHHPRTSLIAALALVPKIAPVKPPRRTRIFKSGNKLIVNCTVFNPPSKSIKRKKGDSDVGPGDGQSSVANRTRNPAITVVLSTKFFLTMFGKFALNVCTRKNLSLGDAGVGVADDVKIVPVAIAPS